MADQEKDKQMEEMLDSLLANYSSAEPRPGMETRILANLHEAAEKEALRGWWNFKWLWAGVVTAAIIIAAMMINGRHRAEPPSNIVVKSDQPLRLQPEIQRSGPNAQKETARVHPRKTIAPTPLKNSTLSLNQRPAIFPTPTPLSEQEQLLLRYMAGTSREEVIAQSHPDESLVSEQDQTEAIPDLTHIPQKLSNTR